MRTTVWTPPMGMRRCVPARGMGTADFGTPGLQPYTPGVYGTSGAMGFTAGGTLTLDGQGDENAVFIFQIGGALGIGANTTVALVNEAQACNVFWTVGTATTIGADSVFVGTMMATGAITMGATSRVDGRLLSRTAAITLPATRVHTAGCATPPPVVVGPPGPAGPAGADGNDGATGPAGADGADGNDGADGTTALTGPAGADGADGDDGLIGLTGLTGLMGATGLTRGANGVTGPTGATGAHGNDGATGPDDSDGAAGPAGADGAGRRRRRRRPQVRPHRPHRPHGRHPGSTAEPTAGWARPVPRGLPASPR